MAKIRGIKPEFWTDEDVCSLSAFARLLFLGMWNYACDNGHLQDKPKQIKRRVLPDDDVNATDLVNEIETQGMIIRADGWITIPKLSHHQRIDQRYFTACDKPGCEAPERTVSQRESRRAPGVQTASAHRVHAVPTLSARVDGDGDGDGDGDKRLSCASGDAPERFDEFWSTYDKKRDRKKSEAKYRLALKKPGVTPETLITAAKTYVEYQRSIGKHPEFTKDPTTWLNGECWNNQVEEHELPRTGEMAWW